MDGFVGDGLAGDGCFAEVVQLDAETELAAGNGYGGTVGEFVLCIAGGISTDESIGGMDPLEYSVLPCGGVAEVEHLAGAVGRKEGGVACGCGLGNFPAYGEEVGTEFAGEGVGFDDDALLLVVNKCGADGVCTEEGVGGGGVDCLVGHGEFECVLGEVAGDADDMTDVVAFKFEHESQVVAKVVAREAET